MKQAATRALYAHWDRLRAGRAAPERSELDPGAMPSILGDVFLLESGSDGRHKVRLAGTRICTLLGREWKGRPFAEPFAYGEHAEMEALLNGVSATAVPAVAGLVGETADGRRLDLELLVLPLRHRGRTNARLLGSLVAEHWPYWAGAVALYRLHLATLRHMTSDGRPAADLDLLTPPRPRVPLGRLRVFPGGRA